MLDFVAEPECLGPASHAADNSGLQTSTGRRVHNTGAAFKPAPTSTSNVAADYAAMTACSTSEYAKAPAPLASSSQVKRPRQPAEEGPGLNPSSNKKCHILPAAEAHRAPASGEAGVRVVLPRHSICHPAFSCLEKDDHPGFRDGALTPNLGHEGIAIRPTGYCDDRIPQYRADQMRMQPLPPAAQSGPRAHALGASPSPLDALPKPAQAYNGVSYMGPTAMICQNALHPSTCPANVCYFPFTGYPPPWSAEQRTAIDPGTDSWPCVANFHLMNATGMGPMWLSHAPTSMMRGNASADFRSW